MLRLATGNDDDDDNEDGDDENVTYSEETIANTVKVPGILWVPAYSSMFRLYEDTMSHHNLDCG